MLRTVTTLFLFVIMIMNEGQAQTAAGQMMIGGGISYYSQSTQANEDYDYTNMSFGPSFGYFLKDNLAIGINLGLEKTESDNGITESENTLYNIGPFVRYYIPTSSESFAFYGQARLDFGGGKTDTTPGGETKTTSIAFAVSPGFSYFFNEHWALDLAFTGLRIQSTDPNKDNDDDKQTAVIFNVQSLTPNIGVRYHFGN
jgi:opacity protein-like surface antigen